MWCVKLAPVNETFDVLALARDFVSTLLGVIKTGSVDTQHSRRAGETAYRNGDRAGTRGIVQHLEGAVRSGDNRMAPDNGQTGYLSGLDDREAC